MLRCGKLHNDQDMGPGGTKSRRDGLFVFLIACLSAVGVLLLLPYRVDDAFIYFRYAEHVAAGHGLSFNIGEEAIEGFSSPVWTALLSLAVAVVGAKALSHVGLGLVLLAMCALVLRREARNSEAPGHAVVTAFALLLCPPMIFYAGTGMETPLFALVVLVFTAAVADRALLW
ncbi:MAG: hypothetical protein GY811_03055 [Myxococcales bacterium]|nr:hypothetical protein [Myxococcales bacterium]